MKATTNFPSYSELKPEHHRKPANVKKADWRAKVLKDTFQPVGTVLDHPQVWILCKLGSCTPAHDECKAKVNMTDEELQAAKNRYETYLKCQATGMSQYDAPPAEPEPLDKETSDSVSES
jgi:hypothetical protein